MRNHHFNVIHLFYSLIRDRITVPSPSKFFPFVFETLSILFLESIFYRIREGYAEKISEIQKKKHGSRSLWFGNLKKNSCAGNILNKHHIFRPIFFSFQLSQFTQANRPMNKKNCF